MVDHFIRELNNSSYSDSDRLPCLEGSFRKLMNNVEEYINFQIVLGLLATLVLVVLAFPIYKVGVGVWLFVSVVRFVIFGCLLLIRKDIVKLREELFLAKLRA